MERIVGSYILPLAYIVWAMVQATAYFPLGQSIYYGFNPITVGTLFLQLGLTGLAEIGCRWRYKRRVGKTLGFQHNSRAPDDCLARTRPCNCLPALRLAGQKAPF